MAKPWDGTKRMERNQAWACTHCAWHTETDFGQYDLSELIGQPCPQCGAKIKRFNVYICPTCREHCYGVDDYNWHSINHYVGTNPLPREVREDMKDKFPALWKAHLADLEGAGQTPRFYTFEDNGTLTEETEAEIQANDVAVQRWKAMKRINAMMKKG